MRNPALAECIGYPFCHHGIAVHHGVMNGVLKRDACVAVIRLANPPEIPEA